MAAMSVATILFVRNSASLDFYLDLDPPRQPRSRAACAVLRCALEIPATSLASFGQKQGRPRVTRVFDGIKADGKLDAMRASLTLELFKSSDCFSEFMCQLRIVDGIKRLRADINVLENKMTALESRGKLMEKKFQHQFALFSKAKQQVESKGDTLENRLEDNIASAQKDLHQDLGLLQDRLEDKMESGLENKLSDVHLTITAFTTKAKSYSDNLRISLNESVTKLGHYLKQDQKEALTNLTSADQYLFDNQSKATGALITATRNLSLTQKVLLNEMQANLAMAANEITESSDNISTILSNEFASLQEDFLTRFQRLASDVNQSAIETLSSANNLFFQTNSTISEVMRHVLSPTRCSRGVVAALSQASYPYPLIQPNSASIVDVPYLCDTVTDGGGYIVIQRRSKGDLDLYRGWEEYKNGFGNLRGDFWLGNRHIHRITSSGSYELRVELFYKGRSAYARYGIFIIAKEASNFSLNVGNYSGTTRDSLIKHGLGKQFTTFDRDNDRDTRRQCAEVCNGGLYDSCQYSGLNGKWQEGDWKGPWWHTLSGRNPVTYTEMKIRRLEIS
ncbi:hypothetical protein RRG08_050756 [Elysia crispata]|uniref:Fibrinogen C-terminal domain-containing protein n=1 Tax=Elysia crispata TaxID=231223 RepID=A0AAE0ZSP2_9GAST|nr:hypothetical protein RRG08_050756 [Elysia crispata]